MVVAETKPRSAAAAAAPSFVHPIYLCQQIDKHLADDAIVIGDGEWEGRAGDVV
jgi:hypothetical protein